MIDIGQLRFAGDQLRAAWDTYIYTFSELHNNHTPTNAPDTRGFSPEFSDLLDTELAFIASYEPKIRKIEVSISRARNYSSGIAPINSLPPEILARIFHLALAQPCDLASLRSGSKGCYPKHIDRLTQVCNLWRRVTVSTCPLWTHIDLTASEPFSDKLLARAELHVARAGNLPIELHVGEDEYLDRYRGNYSYQDELTFVSSIYSRIQRLELTDAYQGFQSALFHELCLHEDTTLTKLALCFENNHYTSFITTNGNYVLMNREVKQLVLDLTHDQLEKAFARLTTLHLRGIFPLWSSSAYRGLIDLRLLSGGYRVRVAEADLIMILKSSPGLRILHYGLIHDPTPSTVEMVPVRLQDLEVVKIHPEYDRGGKVFPSGLLRLLAPETKPLRLSIDDYYTPSDILLAELELFFARSNVARFYTRGVIPPLGVLLRHVTNLETVILHELVHFSNGIIPSEWLDVNDLDLLPRLKSLHISKSVPDEKELDVFFKCCPDGVVLYSCDVERDVGQGFLDVAELCGRYPSVRIVDSPLYSQEDPTGDWDVLD